MERRAYGICLDSQSRGYLGKDRKVSSAAGGNLSRMHKTQETAKESRLNFMYSHLRNRTLVRSLSPWSDGKRRSLPHATGIALRSTNKRQRERRDLLHYTVRPPSAISEHHASRIVSRPRIRPNSRASIPKPDRLLSLLRSCSAPEPMSEPASQSVALLSACRS